MSKLFKKRTISIVVIIAILVIPLIKKIFDFGSPPVKEKECDFTYPNSDTSKPTTIIIKPVGNLIDFEQKGGSINDASCLNKTDVYGIVKVSSIEDINNALQFASENDLKVTSAGQKHSMGGQAFTKQGLILDMRKFNEIIIDKENKILSVQSGATWADIQRVLDKEGLAVKAMQSINIFTVGGTLSVNAHGIAHNPGQIASTVKSFRIMLSNGEIKTASPTENPELYRLALGGYGLFGVILDAELEVVPNEIYEWKTKYVNYTDFADYYSKNILDNENIGLMYGRLSVAPHSYLKEAAIHLYSKVDEKEIPKLEFDEQTWLNRLVINFSKTGGFGRWTRWMLEKYIEPRLHTCLSRNQAMSQKEVCLVSRNQEMYDSMAYLKNKLKDTDILQEYFIPHNKMVDFVDGLRDITKTNNANLLNVTIRIVSKDDITAIPYAKGDRFAFVLYFNQKFNENDSKVLQKTTTDLIDLATNLGGTFYLPYQLYYSNEQLHKAYPDIDSFFEAKRRYDPTELFSNKFYEKYGQ